MKLGIWLFSLFITVQASAQDKVCVLSLFERGSKEDKIVVSAFTSAINRNAIDPNVQVIREAGIAEINHCFSSLKYREVVIAAHGLSTASGLVNYSMPILYNAKTKQKEFLYARYFEVLSRKLPDQASLRKIRVSICGVNFEKTPDIRSTIDILVQNALTLGIQVDISPRFKFGSWVLEEDVTLLSKHWLRESIDSQILKAYYADLARRKPQPGK